MPKPTRFVIIDASALIHRSFHALPPLTTAQGEQVNAVFGFTTILLRVLKEYAPDYLAVAFDVAEKTFRHQEYVEYKATRVKAPQELYDQIPIVKELLTAMKITQYELPGYEADDVIGTLTIREEVDQPNVESIIVTGDKDAFQLVDDNTKVYTLGRSVSDTILYDAAQVEKKLGVTPKQVVDYKALVGDSSDNIPGVPSIGPVTAVKLLKRYGTLQSIYDTLKKDATLEGVSQRVIDLLKAGEKSAWLSQRLATIITDVPVGFSLEACRRKEFDRDEVVALLQRLEFKSLLAKLPEFQVQGALSLPTTKPAEPAKPMTRTAGYHLITTPAQLKPVLANAAKQPAIAVDTETTGLDPLADKLLGVSLSWRDGEAYYVDVRTDSPERPALIELLRPVLENSRIEKYGHNLKFDAAVLRQVDITLAPLAFDTMIASYLLNPAGRQHNLDALVFTELAHEMIPIEQLIGKKGKGQLTMDQVPLEALAEYASEDADYTWRLVAPLRQRLNETLTWKLFTEIEMPLVSILQRIEEVGVLIDTKFLKTMADRLAKQITKLEKSIYTQAGEEFNINSPQQMKRIFFDKLDLDTEGISSTKTGFSTAASELEKLRDAHPIIPLIIEYRELTKLQSTYVLALPELISPADGRVHSSFNQTVAATGRLSSSNPNFQNIPIRTELGKQIRKAIIAPKGFQIVAADYSQLELRIAADLANDQTMITAFRNDEDIHTSTAAILNGVQPEDVTSEMRRAAKAINFGILYGMGIYGLARGTGLDVDQAAEYIESYFDHHTGIKEYMETTKAMARQLGYVETIFGRRRYLPEIRSTNRMIRSSAERMAINMPVQGTEADLIKIAMIRLAEELPKVSPRARMILQVHDELVFEIPTAEVAKAARCIRDEMESAHTFKVPLKVEVEAGPNWGDLEEIK